MTNDNTAEPRLLRELRASVCFFARRGQLVREVMAAEVPERTVQEEREIEQVRRG